MTTIVNIRSASVRSTKTLILLIMPSYSRHEDPVRRLMYSKKVRLAVRFYLCKVISTKIVSMIVKILITIDSICTTCTRIPNECRRTRPRPAQPIMLAHTSRLAFPHSFGFTLLWINDSNSGFEYGEGSCVDGAHHCLCNCSVVKFEKEKNRSRVIGYRN